MSTYWYFRCTEHEPATQSMNEFTQHTEDSYWDEALARVVARPETARVQNLPGVGWFRENVTDFILNHQECHLDIISEYGEIREIENGPNVRQKNAVVLPRMDMAWSDGFEAGADWAANSHSVVTGQPYDPPENPYMGPSPEEDRVDLPVEVYLQLLEAATDVDKMIGRADKLIAVGYLPTSELRKEYW